MKAKYRHSQVKTDGITASRAVLQETLKEFFPAERKGN